MKFKSDVLKEEQDTVIEFDRDGMANIDTTDSVFISELIRKGYDFDKLNAWRYWQGKKIGVRFKIPKKYLVTVRRFPNFDFKG